MSNLAIKSAISALIIVCIILVAHNPYNYPTSTPDMDWQIGVTVLKLLDGGDRQYHTDHPGYINFILIAIYTKVMTLFLNKDYSWSTILHSTNPAEQFLEYIKLIKLYSLVLYLCYCIVIFYLLKKFNLTENKKFISYLILISNYAVLHQVLILRPEFLSAIILAVLLMIVLKFRDIKALLFSGSISAIIMLTKLQGIVALMLIIILSKIKKIDLAPKYKYINILMLLVLFSGHLIIFYRYTDRFHTTLFKSIYIYILPLYIYALICYKLKRANMEAFNGALIFINAYLLTSYVPILTQSYTSLNAVVNYVDWIINFSIINGSGGFDYLNILIGLPIKFIKTRFQIENSYYNLINFLTILYIVKIYKSGQSFSHIIICLIIGLSQEVLFNLRYLSLDYQIYIYQFYHFALFGALKINVRRSAFISLLLVSFINNVFQMYRYDSAFYNRQKLSSSCDVISDTEIYSYLKNNICE